MSAYYNEIEPFCVEWLGNLIKAGEISDGRIDDRSIKEVDPREFEGIIRAHFFAGIGGWDLALRMAGWPRDREVWTGSCPCQPFSSAGKHSGFADDRHLWPEWFRLIRERRPAVVLGEQVASPDGLKWLDAVSSDLEGAGYAFGAADLCAAGVGAPHVRQRLFFVGISNAGLVSWMGNSDENAGRGDAGAIFRAQGAGGQAGINFGDVRNGPEPAGAVPSAWNGCDWIRCSDGKQRPIEPGSFPLAHGVPGRVGRLRAYGNAIVPQAAAIFVRAVMEILG